MSLYYRDALRVTDKKASARHHKEFKATVRYDYQFFRADRLEALERKDHDSKQKLFHLRHALRLKQKEEKRVQDENDKLERRKVRFFQKREAKRKAHAEAAAGKPPPGLPGVHAKKSGDPSRRGW